MSNELNETNEKLDTNAGLPTAKAWNGVPRGQNGAHNRYILDSNGVHPEVQNDVLDSSFGKSKFVSHDFFDEVFLLFIAWSEKRGVTVRPLDVGAKESSSPSLENPSSMILASVQNELLKLIWSIMTICNKDPALWNYKIKEEQSRMRLKMILDPQ